MDFFEYMDLATFTIILIAILSVIALVNNAIKAIKEMTKPITDLRRDIDKLNNRLDEVDEKLEEDYRTLEHEQELDRLLLKSVRQLLEHSIDGNNVQAMVDMNNEIDKFLINNAT